jgi:hypothetical protein
MADPKQTEQDPAQRAYEDQVAANSQHSPEDVERFKRELGDDWDRVDPPVAESAPAPAPKSDAKHK